jgi:hypothetical protein
MQLEGYFVQPRFDTPKPDVDPVQLLVDQIQVPAVQHEGGDRHAADAGSGRDAGCDCNKQVSVHRIFSV